MIYTVIVTRRMRHNNIQVRSRYTVAAPSDDEAARIVRARTPPGFAVDNISVRAADFRDMQG